MRFINSIALLLVSILFLYSCFNEKKEKETNVENVKVTEQTKNVVKMHPVVFNGNRYVVMADFGLKEKVPLMVHSNATFYIMINHEVAEKLNQGKPLKKISDFGYSEKGMGIINVEEFKIGNDSFTANNVSVFDLNEEQTVQGMIGTKFLKEERVRVNFLNEELEIGIEVNNTPDKTLVNQGYKFVKFIIDKNDEIYTEVYFEALKKEIPINISTVAEGLQLHVNLFKEKLKMKKLTGVSNSPYGTSTDVFKSENPVRFELNGIALSCDAIFEDYAEYNEVDESELATYGALGRDWMKENNAIIDFANQILYFKTNTKTTASKKK